MPPRKEPKEIVTYPASKRKAPPFKPQRPSKVPQTSSSDLRDASSKPTQAGLAGQRKSHDGPAKNVINSATPASKGTIRQLKAGADRRAALARKASLEIPPDSDVSESAGINTDSGSEGGAGTGNEDSSSDGSLEIDPMAATSRRKKQEVKSKQAAPQRSRILESSQMPPDASLSPANADNENLFPSQSEAATSIPPQLLVRILHEHFDDRQTKIDKQAMGVLDQYLEIFVREAIARASLQKKQDVERGQASQSDAGWLESKDLEKVAPGMLLDF